MTDEEAQLLDAVDEHFEELLCIDKLKPLLDRSIFVTDTVVLKPEPTSPPKLIVSNDAVVRDCWDRAIAIFGATTEELALLKDILKREKTNRQWAHEEKENPVLDSLIEKVEILKVKM